MKQYEINGVKVEVIREESRSTNYTIFKRLTSLINAFENESDPIIKDGICKDKLKETKP